MGWMTLCGGVGYCCCCCWIGTRFDACRCGCVRIVPVDCYRYCCYCGWIAVGRRLRLRCVPESGTWGNPTFWSPYLLPATTHEYWITRDFQSPTRNQQLETETQRREQRKGGFGELLVCAEGTCVGSGDGRIDPSIDQSMDDTRWWVMYIQTHTLTHTLTYLYIHTYKHTNTLTHTSTVTGSTVWESFESVRASERVWVVNRAPYGPVIRFEGMCRCCVSCDVGRHTCWSVGLAPSRGVGRGVPYVPFHSTAPSQPTTIEMSRSTNDRTFVRDFPFRRQPRQ